MAAHVDNSRDGLYHEAKRIAGDLDIFEAKDAKKILSIARTLL